MWSLVWKEGRVWQAQVLQDVPDGQHEAKKVGEIEMEKGLMQQKHVQLCF